MGTRHARFSEGGRKFNGVDGVITGYQFTTVHPFAKEGRQSSSSFNPLYGVITARMDGAKEDEIDVLLVGSADDYDISDEEATLTPIDGKAPWPHSQWAKFIFSLEHLGVECESDTVGEDSYNYTPIIGRRVRFSQEIQFDKTGKVKTRKGKGRDGKERDYNDTTTVVAADYGYVSSSAPTSASGQKGAVKSPTAGKPNGKIAEVDLTKQADLALAGLLEKFGGSTPKVKLVSAPAQLFLKKNYPNTSDELRKMLYDDDFLNGAVERGAISEYKQSSKEQLITA